MKLTRKQAMLLLVAAPAGVAQSVKPEGVVVDGNGVTWTGTGTYPVSSLWDQGRRVEHGLSIELADGPVAAWPPGGFTYIEVAYNGQTKRFTAKEIWEALK